MNPENRYQRQNTPTIGMFVEERAYQQPALQSFLATYFSSQNVEACEGGEGYFLSASLSNEEEKDMIAKLSNIPQINLICNDKIGMSYVVEQKSETPNEKGGLETHLRK